MAQATLTLHKDREEAAEPAAPKARRGRGLLRCGVGLLLMAGVGGWFAPAVVGRGVLRHRLVHVVVPAYPGGVTVGEASLGWFDPVVLRDVSLADPAGGRFVRIGEVRTSSSLARLAFGRGADLGTVTFTRPEALIRLRRDGSNLEDAVRPLLEGESSTSGLKIVVEGGKARWGAGEGQAFAPSKIGIDDLSVTFSRKAGSSSPEKIEIDGRLTDGETAGDFSASFIPSVKEGAPSDVSIAATEAPLGVLQPWLDRFGLAVGLSGKASADVVGTVVLEGDFACGLDGRVEGRRLWVTSPESLGGETLQIDSVVLTGKGSATTDLLTLEGVELQSDVGTATANGRFGIASGLAAPGGWESRLDALIREDARVTASVDLAKVVSSFGRVLRLREPIESGRMELEWRSGAAEEGRQGTLRLQTTDLVAGSGERRVTWREPLSGEVTVRRAAGVTRVERLHAESEGVTVTGSGSLRDCELRFEADLDRLRGQVARLVELPVGTLAGRASGRVAAKVADGNDPGRVHVEAAAAVRDLTVAMPGRRWTERDLSLTAEAELLVDGTSARRVESGRVVLRSVEEDEMTATLAGPVDLAGEVSWPIDATLSGDLARWSRRAGAWSVPVLPEGWTAAGVITASGSVAGFAAEASVSNFSAEARNLRLTLPDRTLDEPYVRVVGGVRWGDGVLGVSSATLTSETASAKATGVVIPLAGDRPASGSLSFRGGAGRIGRYLLPAQPPVWLSGVVGGTVDLESVGNATRATAQLTFEKPVLTRPVSGGTGWQPVWSDEKATVAVTGSYDHGRDQLELQSSNLVATGLAIEAQGQVMRTSDVADADLTGAIDCDLGTFAARLATGLPDGIAARGRAKRSFSVRGPLGSAAGIDPALTAKAGLGWEEIRAFGLTVGTGEVAGRLERQELHFGPFDWPVAGGRVRGTAKVAFAGVPTLTMAPGRVGENLQLTPEVCRTWLRYAAPSLADAAEVQGTLSVDVQTCTVPLALPTGTEATGVLAVQAADAAPGPLARSILDAVRQVQAIAGRDGTNGSDLRLVVPAQDVKVNVTRGRVFHDRFAVRLGDADGVTVATSGSVGFDETVDLVAEVPLDPKWFKEERVAAMLGGQTVRVPIRGTLARPQPDPRVFQDLARRAASGAVKDVIDRQLEKQIGDPLKKLFGRGQQEP